MKKAVALEEDLKDRAEKVDGWWKWRRKWKRKWNKKCKRQWEWRRKWKGKRMNGGMDE